MNKKVRIVKCSNPEFWYKDLVGNEYELLDKDDKQNVCKINVIGQVAPWIDKDDCIILENIIHYKLNNNEIKLAIFEYVTKQIEVPEGQLRCEFHYQKNKEELSCELVIKEKE